MKNHDLLDAIGEVSEKTVLKYALPDEKHIERAKDEKHMKEKETKPITQTKKKPFRIHPGAAVAAVALCIGLNAAIFYGIHKMRQTPDTFKPGMAPEVQNLDQPYMEAYEVVPTGIRITLRNDTETDHIPYNPQYIITKDGKKVADAELPPGLEYVPDIQQGKSGQQLCFEQLPAGNYTLVNLEADGKTEGVLGHLDFEITSDFDSMVYIPDQTGHHIDVVNELLAKYDITVLNRQDVLSEQYDKDIVVMMMPVPYSVSVGEDGSREEHTRTDGKGCWMKPGEQVDLYVSTGKVDRGEDEENTARMPDVTGMEYETAKETLINLGFFVDKRGSYDPEVPEGKVISTDPAGPCELSLESYIRVTVSLGPNKDTLPVPNFVGMDRAMAQATAESLLFTVTMTEVEDEAPEGTVLSQSIAPQEEVSEGTNIELTVSSGTKQ